MLVLPKTGTLHYSAQFFNTIGQLKGRKYTAQPPHENDGKIGSVKLPLETILKINGLKPNGLEEFADPVVANLNLNSQILYKHALQISHQAEYYKGKAWYYLFEAAIKGNLEALNDLAMQFIKNDHLSDPKGKKKSDIGLELLEDAASFGHADSYINLGYLYLNGIGVNKSFKKALQYYERAEELDHPDATNTIASIWKEFGMLRPGKDERRKLVLDIIKKPNPKE